LLLEVLFISEAHSLLLKIKEINKRPGFLTFGCHDGVNNVISYGRQPLAVAEFMVAENELQECVREKEKIKLKN
jgi:hypothetical protein